MYYTHKKCAGASIHTSFQHPREVPLRFHSSASYLRASYCYIQTADLFFPDSAGQSPFHVSLSSAVIAKSAI